MSLQLLAWLATAGIIGIFVHTVRLWFVSRPGPVPPAAVPRQAERPGADGDQAGPARLGEVHRPVQGGQAAR